MRFSPRVAVMCALGVLLAGCGADDGAQAEFEFDFDSPEPLTALPACDPPPPASGDAVPTGAALPPGAIVIGVTPQGPITSVLGYVEMTPIGIRLDYQERDGDDVEVLIIEDEVFEVELLVSTGQHRMFLKGRSVCDAGTQFQAVVAPEVDAEGLPIPAGTEPTDIPTG